MEPELKVMNPSNLSTVFSEIQRWKMAAIAVSESGEIVLAIGYDGTLKELPRVEEIWMLRPNTWVKHLSRSQVRSEAELAEIVRGMVGPPARLGH